ncbi:hypothetical protein ACFL6C_11750 [Myxococcota bacterium]
MSLIAEAIARWDGPERQAEAEHVLEAFVTARRHHRDDPVVLATLPEQARFAGQIVLTSMRSLEATLGRELHLVVDHVCYVEPGGSQNHVGIGVGETAIERVDDMGASPEQAHAISATFLGLLESLAWRHCRHACVLILD